MTFTGSTDGAQRDARRSGKPDARGIELGGKSPHLVFADTARMDDAVDAACCNVFFNQGAVCDGGTRLLLQRSIHDEFLEKLVAKTKKLTVGDPMTDVHLGPIISEEQGKRILQYIETGKQEAALVTGGAAAARRDLRQGLLHRADDLRRRWRKARIAQEEIFGPVLAVQTFEDEEEAIAIANDNGLAAGYGPGGCCARGRSTSTISAWDRCSCRSAAAKQSGFGRGERDAGPRGISGGKDHPHPDGGGAGALGAMSGGTGMLQKFWNMS